MAYVRLGHGAGSDRGHGVCNGDRGRCCLPVGGSSLIWVAYAGLAVWAIVRPRSFAVVLLALIVIFQPGALGLTRYIAKPLWVMPEGIDAVMPLQMNPIEALLVIGTISLVLRTGLRARSGELPGLIWFIPVVMAIGYAWGVWVHGGQGNLAYHEARGLIFGGIAFIAARRLLDTPPRWLHVSVLCSTAALAIITLLQYHFFVRVGSSPVPVQFLFAHESVVLLAIGLVYGIALFLRASKTEERGLLLLHQLLLVVAILATGRRSGTLVVGVAVLVIIWFLMVRRPMPVLWLALAGVLVGGVYLGAYWDKQYGVLAQPARAIRSQIDPALKDESSDTYRDRERYNVIKTIRLGNPALGIGFGQEFAPFKPLPPAPWWPLQFFTPHDNILWLWLKMGVVGASVVLGVWVLAMKRCISAFVTPLRSGAIPVVPLALGASLVIFMAFARIDLVLVTGRGMIPLGAILAIAFSLPREAKSEGREPGT